MIGKYDLLGWVRGVVGLGKASLVPAGLYNTVLRVTCRVSAPTTCESSATTTGRLFTTSNTSGGSSNRVVPWTNSSASGILISGARRRRSWTNGTEKSSTSTPGSDLRSNGLSNGGSRPSENSGPVRCRRRA